VSLFLLGGAVLVFMTFMRYSLPALGWFVFAPFLVLLHESGSRKRHLAVLAALVVGFLAAVSKMVTPEISWAPVPMFAVSPHPRRAQTESRTGRAERQASGLGPRQRLQL
jgi:hypothetical protein